jgi:hypothetical protein
MSQNIRPIKNIKIFIPIGVILSFSQKKDKNCRKNIGKKKKEQRTTKSIKFTKEK